MYTVYHSVAYMFLIFILFILYLYTEWAEKFIPQQKLNLRQKYLTLRLFDDSF